MDAYRIGFSSIIYHSLVKLVFGKFKKTCALHSVYLPESIKACAVSLIFCSLYFYDPLPSSSPVQTQLQIYSKGTMLAVGHLVLSSLLLISSSILPVLTHPHEVSTLAVSVNSQVLIFQEGDGGDGDEDLVKCIDIVTPVKCYNNIKLERVVHQFKVGDDIDVDCYLRYVITLYGHCEV
jgi:hypothetical protein